MAKIPLGNFGNLIAQPVTRRTIPAGAFDNGGAGLQKAGAMGMQLAGDMLAEQRDLEQKVQRMTTLAGIQTGLADLHDQTIRGVADGSIPKDAAESSFAEASNKLVSEKMDGLHPDFQKVIKAETLGITGRYSNAVRDSVVKRSQQDTRVGLFDFIEQQSRLALTDREKASSQMVRAIDDIGPSAGFNPVEIHDLKKRGNDDIAYTVAKRMVTNSSNSIESVDAALKALDGPEYSGLGNARREALYAHLVNARTRIDTRIRHDADKRLADAEKATQEFESQISTTNRARPDDYINWEKRVRGTPEEPRFAELKALEQEVQKVIALPPELQDQFITEARSAQRINGASEKQIRTLAATERAISENRKAMVEHPLKYLSERTGQSFAPITPALLQEGGEAIQREMQSRVSALYGLRKSTSGRTELKVFSPDEADHVGKMLSASPPAIQGALLGVMRNAINDPKAFSDTVRQIAKDDPVLAYAGVAKGRNLMTTTGLALSDLLLEGRAVLRDGSFKMPSEESGVISLKKTFNEYVGDAIEPGASAARDDTFRAATAVYAKLAKDHGQLDGILNSDIASRAIELVTGGVIKHAGYKTISPYGMGADVFNEKAFSALKQAEAENGQPAGAFAGLRLRAIAPNRYELLNGQRRQVGKDGMPIFLNIE